MRPDMNPFKIKYQEHPFEIGDKVVLVTSGPKEPSGFSQKLQHNTIYVVRETGFGDGEPTVKLVGIFGPECWDGSEREFYASHFLSLAELRANIAARLAARRGLKLDFMPDPEPKKQHVGKTKGRRKATA